MITAHRRPTGLTLSSLRSKAPGQCDGVHLAGDSVYFWPIYTAGELSMDQWRARMWFDTWI